MNKHTKHYQEIRDGFVLRDSNYVRNEEEEVVDEDTEDDDTDSSAGSNLNTVILPLLNRK